MNQGQVVAVDHSPRGSAIVIEHAPPTSVGPGDASPITANFGYEGFTHELTDRPLELVVGDAVDLTTRYPGAQIDVIREPKPSGDQPTAYTLRPPRFVPRAPGLFVLSVTLPGGWRREITAACFLIAALELLEFPANQAHHRRMRLRAMIRDPRVTRETIVAALEHGETDFRALLGLKPNAALNLKMFG